MSNPRRKNRRQIIALRQRRSPNKKRSNNFRIANVANENLRSRAFRKRFPQPLFTPPAKQQSSAARRQTLRRGPADSAACTSYYAKHLKRNFGGCLSGRKTLFASSPNREIHRSRGSSKHSNLAS